MDVEVAGSRIVVLAGDLTRQDVDAVVNAANARLQHGGGVAAAIAIGGGPQIQRESDRWVKERGPLTDGEAAVTTAGTLPAEHVVHVAGPVYDAARDDNAPRLRMAVVAALNAATEAGARTIAFPAISAGVYGYPLDDATAVLGATIVSWCRDHTGTLDEIRLVGFDERARDAFAAGLARAIDDA